MVKVGVAAIFKNERPYVLEWVAYHRLLGADSIIIADNVSDDGTSQLLEALHLAGIIKRLHVPRIGEQGPQAAAYAKILQQYGDELDLIAFIDADEFIVATKHDLNPIQQLRDVYTRTPDLGAIALNWRIFGSSGQFFAGEGLVLERFSACSDRELSQNFHIKSAVRPSCVQAMAIHHATLCQGRYYSASGEPVDFVEENPAFSTAIHDEDVVLHHYVIKSLAEHQQFKYRKGSAAGLLNRQKGQHYFEVHDQNNCIQPFPVGLLLAVQEQMVVIKQQLHQQTPYYAVITAHLDSVWPVLQGWAVCAGKELTIKLLVNDMQEYLVELEQLRPDVVAAGFSSVERCGFRFEWPEEVDEQADIKITVFGCNTRIFPSAEWSE